MKLSDAPAILRLYLMTRRNATTSACTNGDSLNYDVKNRLTSTMVGSITTSFSYNGDGARTADMKSGDVSSLASHHAPRHDSHRA